MTVIFEQIFCNQYFMLSFGILKVELAKSIFEFVIIIVQIRETYHSRMVFSFVH